MDQDDERESMTPVGPTPGAPSGEPGAESELPADLSPAELLAEVGAPSGAAGIQAQIDALRADPRYQHGHPGAKAGMSALYQRLYPAEGAAPSEADAEPEPAHVRAAVDTLWEAVTSEGRAVEFTRSDVLGFMERAAMVEDDATELQRLAFEVFDTVGRHSREAPLSAAESHRVLERTWGAETNQKLQLAGQAVALLYPDAGKRALEYLDRTGLRHNPRLIRAAVRFVERHQARRAR